MELVTGMNIMAAQTGDGDTLTGMQKVEIAVAVTEAGLVGFLHRHH